jgi:flavin reductase (DIM6/NTAB) family NADH-FMN oxidoreductase RutF
MRCCSASPTAWRKKSSACGANAAATNKYLKLGQTGGNDGRRREEDCTQNDPLRHLRDDAETSDGALAAATVNWVTQTSFDPPLVVVGVKADSSLLAVVKKAGGFALNMLGKGQQGAAFTFFKPATRDGDTIAGESVRAGTNGAPILTSAVASVECKVVEIVERGDHHIVIGEVVEANVAKEPEGRADEAILEMKDLGEKIFYGG